jgi:hypothetical protein
MLVRQVTTAIKVGAFGINTKNTKARLRMKWEDIDKSIITNNSGRVYLLVVNDVIKKIGGSVSKGGIKSTMSFYESANCGRPSIRSFGIQQLVFEELCLDNKVEVYMITSEQVVAPVKGLLGKKDISISAFKEMEEACLDDYVALEGEYPEWNFQESGKPWYSRIQEAHAQQMTNSVGTA